jgi:primosomal protein N' (replication factor Y)
MTSEVYARIVFQSPLPALDREFEYVVPEELLVSVAIGCRVKVPFAGQTKEGFVVALDKVREFPGKLSSVSSVVSSTEVLKPHIYQLLKAISSRQCCSIGELLDTAVPKRSVRVEKAFKFNNLEVAAHPPGLKFAELVRPVFDQSSSLPGYVSRICNLANEYFLVGRSVVICVPDFRDVQKIASVLGKTVPAESLSIIDSNDVGSRRYETFLTQLQTEPRVVLGTRSAIYSPISQDAAIIVWDDGDQSHQDQQAPYLTTREIALIRQSQFQAPLHFLSHSRSTEVQRLVEIGYLTEHPSSSWRPKVAIAEGRGLEGTSFKVIKQGLEVGPVLFQVAAPGTARSLYCATCNARSKCNKCNGPLWMNSGQKIVCRWCGQFNQNFECKLCAGSTLSQGAAGATRWVEQLGKSFPGIPIREVTAETGPFEISERPQIVVATPGIEPVASLGYSAIVFVDCFAQLSRDSLRAPEDALRGWLNALGFMSSTGTAVAVGVSPEVSEALSLGDVIGTASKLLSEREELGFPPARRIVSATGSRELVGQLGESLSQVPGVTVLGLAASQTSSVDADFRMLATFTYASGNQVAAAAREFLFGLGSKSIRTNAKSGRSIRPVTIKFDDPRVL